MKRLAGLVIVPLLLVAVAPEAMAAKKPVVEHSSFESTPFLLDLSDPSGSTQCDVQAIGYDTGIVNYIAFTDSAGNITHDIYIQSLSTILTNPENGKSIEIRSGFNWKLTSITEDPDGSITIQDQFNGLNVLYQGDSVMTLAGHVTGTFTFTFNKGGHVTSVDVIEDFTPHLGHSFAFFCEVLS